MEDIQQNIADCITFENDIIPSNEALYFHWKRSYWVLYMWRQADKDSMVLLPITEYGWTLRDNKLTLFWGMPQNIQAIHDRVNLLLKVCRLSHVAQLRDVAANEKIHVALKFASVSTA